MIAGTRLNNSGAPNPRSIPASEQNRTRKKELRAEAQRYLARTKSPGKLIEGVLDEATADEDARATAQALFAAHVARDGKVIDEQRFVESITAALIAARIAGRLE